MIMSATAGRWLSADAPKRLPPSRGLIAGALWFVGAFTAAALLYAAQWGMQVAAQGPVDWGHTFAVSGASWFACAVAALPLVWLAWFYPLGTSNLYRTVPVYVAALIAAAVLRIAIYVPLYNALFGGTLSFVSSLRTDLIPEFIFQISVVTIVMAIRYYRSARERELRAAQLESEVTQARLEALQTQLHPHFLFNTLHCVSTLMHRNVDEADEMLVRLCDLLRITLERPDRAEIPLGEELAILERYLDIMEMRFPNRLRVKVDVPGDVLKLAVPALLLQPLVENVLRHGLDESSGVTDVLVSARRTNGTLDMRVVDNGRGLREGSPRFGIGLENTRRRLETLYGTRASMRLEPAEPTGTCVAVTVPARDDS